MHGRGRDAVRHRIHCEVVQICAVTSLAQSAPVRRCCHGHQVGALRGVVFAGRTRAQVKHFAVGSGSGKGPPAPGFQVM